MKTNAESAMNSDCSLKRSAPTTSEPAKPANNRLNHIKPDKNHLTLFASCSCLRTNHINRLFRKKTLVHTLDRSRARTGTGKRLAKPQTCRNSYDPWFGCAVIARAA